MITKKIKNIALTLMAGCGLAVTTTSCNDFLEIMPMNEVVLENFWKEKADVESVVAGCYDALATPDCLQRLAIWGELRSDNLVEGSNVSQDIRELLKENLLQTNSYCNWSKVYDCINRCNTVCFFAPQVQEKDPNYSYDEMRAHLAEVKTLRALCYFYLIRTFRDVPYVTRPSIDDTEEFIVPANPFNDVLDSLINDMKSVQNDAVRRYRMYDAADEYMNSAHITRAAIWTLLADLYLWKGDWDNVIYYCDKVLDYKRQQYKELKELDPLRDDIELYDDIPLIVENPSGSTTYGSAYEEIFGSGNSFESIFELYFNTQQNVNNSWVSDYYGSSNNTNGRMHVPDFLAQSITDGEVFTPTDCRAYESVSYNGTSYNISKYVNTSVSFQTLNLKSRSDLKLTSTTRSDNYANWIFYRLSDVLLMKAEALIERSTEGMTNPDEGAEGDVEPAPAPAADPEPDNESDFNKAFRLIDIVSRRGHGLNMTKSHSDALDKTKYLDTKTAMRELLMDERQREFLFEGKRWFDLVRVARRDGNNKYLIDRVARKYKEERGTVQIKLADPNIIYWPYAKTELKANPLLKQNPAFLKGENSELSK